MIRSIVVCLALTVLLLTVFLADAQQTGKIFRIGFLDSSIASASAVLVESFRQELSKLGWIEGKNIAMSTDLRRDSLSAKLSLRGS